MSLSDLIKQMSVGANDASKPVNVLYGTVTKINPLEVNVDQRFTLDEDFLVVTERLSRYEVDLKHNHTYINDGSQSNTGDALPDKIVIREGLKVGDKVLLLRVQGGQQYVVWDKVIT
ncbi:DUF2577 domain-containing protein [Paenibacillus oralis]|uniref:DUF2577 domain-containing protein n=1 Tax=Paenibacillus oralis TaxID=2490856 RepID=A0A3P3TXF8_9BACL|nr:DUF2577 domain-containing protein [Paenibacillus oralis]RRJ62396.1 DUF2577 domain-containing protein [Paenibacillus oralis]